jgi:hypothetical protein
VVKTPANALCPSCGDQGELESTGGGREWRCACPTCVSPVGFGFTQVEAVDNWLGDTEQQRRRHGGRSPAEAEWLLLLRSPNAYAAHVDQVRRAWEAENVVWFHGYRNGKAVWKPERPPPDPVDADLPAEDRSSSRFERRRGSEGE